MAKNDFLARIRRQHELDLARQRAFTIQWCADAAILAANEVFQRRGEKIVEFNDTFVRYANEIARMTLEDAQADREIVYTKEKIDRKLRDILGDAFLPWEARYK